MPSCYLENTGPPSVPDLIAVPALITTSRIPMPTFVVSFVVFLCVFGVGFLASILRGKLPEHHLSPETKDTVKITMGLVGTMTALILGLLVASAKGTYDTQRTDIIGMAAKLMVLDRTLAHYGPEAQPTRLALRDNVGRMIARLWPESRQAKVEVDPTAVAGDSLYDAIEALKPQDDSQRQLKTLALSSAIDIAKARWLFFAQSASAISIPLLAIVILWLTVLSGSFGLFAPSNGTARASLFICALSVSGAIFLILELDTPLTGLIKIPEKPMQMVLEHLGK